MKRPASPSPSRTALILGDGISGLSAACVMAKAGWRVVLAGGGKAEVRAARFGHVHVVAEGVLRQLARLTGLSPDYWDSIDALCLNGEASGRRDRALRPMPLIAPDQLHDGLSQLVPRQGIIRQSICALRPVGTEFWHWGGDCNADIVIDASGTGRALAQLANVDIIQDEMEERDLCHSFPGRADAGDPFLILAKHVMACDAVLARFSDGRCLLTVRGTQVPPPPALLLDAILLSSDALWADRMRGVRFDPKPARYCAPLARVTQIADADAMPPAMFIGDALLQTAPRFGQGIAQLTQHLSALSQCLATAGDLRALGQDMTRAAEMQWSAMALAASPPHLAQAVHV